MYYTYHGKEGATEGRTYPPEHYLSGWKSALTVHDAASAPIELPPPLATTFAPIHRRRHLACRCGCCLHRQVPDAICRCVCLSADAAGALVVILHVCSAEGRLGHSWVLHSIAMWGGEWVWVPVSGCISSAIWAEIRKAGRQKNKEVREREREMDVER